MRVFLVIRVQEHPRIERYIFSGNDALDEEDLDKVVTFVSGQILKPQAIYKTVRDMKKLYDEESLMNAEINLLFSFLVYDNAAKGHRARGIRTL